MYIRTFYVIDWTCVECVLVAIEVVEHLFCVGVWIRKLEVCIISLGEMQKKDTNSMSPIAEVGLDGVNYFIVT